MIREYPGIPEYATIRIGHIRPSPIDNGFQLAEQHHLYYYAREPHPMTGGRDEPLPILRVVFADPGETWVHIDPRTGAVLGRLDSGRRASRWLFAMLHSWDWLYLLERRPLWDPLLIVLSLGGLAFSATGIVIGWRRLGRRGNAGRHIQDAG